MHKISEQVYYVWMKHFMQIDPDVIFYCNLWHLRILCLLWSNTASRFSLEYPVNEMFSNVLVNIFCTLVWNKTVFDWNFAAIYLIHPSPLLNFFHTYLIMPRSSLMLPTKSAMNTGSVTLENFPPFQSQNTAAWYFGMPGDESPTRMPGRNRAKGRWWQTTSD